MSLLVLGAIGIKENWWGEIEDRVRASAHFIKVQMKIVSQMKEHQTFPVSLNPTKNVNPAAHINSTVALSRHCVLLRLMELRLGK